MIDIQPIATLLTTVATMEDADRLARVLVEERLAACVTSLPGARSLYRWHGRIEHAEEIVVLIKTSTELVNATRERLRALHPYDVPEILQCGSLAATAEYADWVAGEVREPEGG